MREAAAMDAGLVEPMAGKLRLKIRQSQSRSPLRGHGDSIPQTRPLAAASRMWQARATQAAEGWQMEWTSAFRASPWRRGGLRINRINDELAPMTASAQTEGEFDGTLDVRSVRRRRRRKSTLGAAAGSQRTVCLNSHSSATPLFPSLSLLSAPALVGRGDASDPLLTAMHQRAS